MLMLNHRNWRWTFGGRVASGSITKTPIACLCVCAFLIGCKKTDDVPAVAVRANVVERVERDAGSLPQLKVAHGEFADVRDGQSYAFVTFDSLFVQTKSGYTPYSQTWMTENLNYSGDDGQGRRTYEKGWCSERGEDIGYPAKRIQFQEGRSCRDGYGLVYSWTMAMALDDSVVTDSGPRSLQLDSSYSYMKHIKPIHQGICPEGWRLPEKNDWDLLLENLDRNRRFVFVSFRTEPTETGCEEEHCETESDPPPEILSYLKARLEDKPDWGSESDAQDPYDFGLFPGYSYWTTTLDAEPRDDNYPNAPRVSVFVDPTGRYWGWQAKHKYWNTPGSLLEGNFVRCIKSNENGSNSIPAQANSE